MDKATERLLAMRSTAARYGHGIDKRDRDDVSSATAGLRNSNGSPPATAPRPPTPAPRRPCPP
ncbi:hypothetical protein GTW46_41040 [Streptomyces sp. SID6013]|nr:hypothetical protein [Streptomyces sp. SID6013]